MRAALSDDARGIGDNRMPVVVAVAVAAEYVTMRQGLAPDSTASKNFSPSSSSRCATGRGKVGDERKMKLPGASGIPKKADLLCRTG